MIRIGKLRASTVHKKLVQLVEKTSVGLRCLNRDPVNKPQLWHDKFEDALRCIPINSRDVLGVLLRPACCYGEDWRVQSEALGRS